MALPQPLDHHGLPTVVPPVGAPPSRSWKRLGLNFLAVSIAAHVFFGVVAAYLIVQTGQAKRKQAFVGAPHSDAPERAIEHKVQMQRKQQTMSAPTARRITTTSNVKVALPDMPAMPSLSSAVVPAAMTGMGGTGLGLGSGTAGGGGSGNGNGSGSRPNLFGIRDVSHGGGLEGTFYDLKQTSTRQPTNMTPETYGKILTDFVNGGFNEGLLSRFFKSPHPLLTTQIWIPQINADRGPAAFQLEGVVQPRMWCVLYKGRVTAPESFTFHFVGAGDDVMLVRFDGRLVLDRCWYIRTNWKALANYSYDFSHIPNGFAKGDAIEVKAGKSYPIEVLIGEQPGGESFATLLQEIDGVTYDKDERGNPILPVFRTADVKPAASTPATPYPPHRDDGPVWKVAPPLLSNTSIFDH